MKRNIFKILSKLPTKDFTLLRSLIILTLGFVSIVSFGQRGGTRILDDSTQNVYNETTVSYYLEDQLLKNDSSTFHPDTLIDGFRYIDWLRESGWSYQDLGNTGTAARSYMQLLPSNIATQNGFEAFDLYSPNAKELKYYNTKSPYTNMFYEQNNRGMLRAGFKHSQNIKPNWNATFDVNRLTSSKQFSATTSEDRLIDHWNYTFSTSYRSNDKKYTILFSFIHFNHKQNEQGGIETGTETLQIEESRLDADYNSFYEERLQGVSSRQRWNDIHIYQEFNPSSGFQLFNRIDYKRHLTTFSDRRYSTNYNPINYADTTSLDSLKVQQRFQVIQNEIGLKGRYKGFNYIASIMPRAYFNDMGIKKSGLLFEMIGKLDLNYTFKDSTDYLNGNIAVSNNGYLINGSLFLKNAELQFHHSERPPELLYQEYLSDLYTWKNDFKTAKVTSLNFSYPLSYKRLSLHPKITLQSLSDYLYFNNQQVPVQHSSSIEVVQIEAKAAYHGKWLNLSQEVRFNTNDNNKIMAIPTWTLHTNAEAKINYAKVLDLYLGIDLHYKSAHYARAYSPLLQSFYEQGVNQVWGMPVADTYVKFKVKNVKAALALTYLNQGLQSQGYFTTPGYLALRRAFWIKVNWPLFS